MEKTIVEILLSSEKRKNVLLRLQDGPQEMGSLIKLLDTTRIGLLPQIKVLKESNLVYQHGDTYELTTIGKLIVAEMRSFLRAVNMFGANSDYLGTHYIDFIPLHLLKKMPELGSFNICESQICDMFDPETDFIEKAIRSNYWIEVTSMLHPSFHNFYMEIVDQGVDVSIIITQEIYDKFKRNHYDDFKEVIDTKLISLYLYPKSLEFASFILADQCINFKLLTQQGIYDRKKMLICSPAALEWGKEFFEYYRRQSTIIFEI